ncbi:hypothetical protein B0O80DRAFT_431425 [Mortierella sp. GBAus27b]|nr:hypothetical protein B0O80DRAFT_431425 [Mortierella sp. GBAus27b]
MLILDPFGFQTQSAVPPSSLRPETHNPGSQPWQPTLATNPWLLQEEKRSHAADPVAGLTAYNTFFNQSVIANRTAPNTTNWALAINTHSNILNYGYEAGVTATGQTARSNNQDPSSQESPFRHAIPSSEYTLTPRQALHIADVYLRNALRENDHDIAMVMCRHADILLNQSKVFQSTSSTSSSDPEDQALREFGATAYSDIGKVLEAHGHQSRARIFYGKCRKLG